MRDFCIFAHFDPHDVVDTHVLHYLEQLEACGFFIVFVTTSAIDAAQRARVMAHCVDCIVRDNVGHDFGSWSAGLARWRDRIEGRLLLANDSVYGPLLPLGPQLERLTSVKADFYGMVLNREVRPHLQSWFLLFEPQVVRSAAFGEIFCQPPRPRSRMSVIEDFELTATQRLAEAGFTCHALHMPGARALIGNPAVYLWRELIERDAVPFLKVGVLRLDPIGLFTDGRWRDFIGRIDAASLARIDTHRARLAAGDPPLPPLLVRWRRRGYRRLMQIDDRVARTGSRSLIRLNRLVMRALLPLIGGEQRRLAPSARPATTPKPNVTSRH